MLGMTGGPKESFLSPPLFRMLGETLVCQYDSLLTNYLEETLLPAVYLNGIPNG